MCKIWDILNISIVAIYIYIYIYSCVCIETAYGACMVGKHCNLLRSQSEYG